MFDVCLILYFPFVNKQSKKLYTSRLHGIYFCHETSEESKVRVEASQNVLSKKRLTKKGKERILKKLFVAKKKTCLYVSVYSLSLQLMKKYVKIFKQTALSFLEITGNNSIFFKSF